MKESDVIAAASSQASADYAEAKDKSAKSMKVLVALHLDILICSLLLGLSCLSHLHNLCNLWVSSEGVEPKWR